jgi:hypothetical protein
MPRLHRQPGTIVGRAKELGVTRAALWTWSTKDGWWKDIRRHTRDWLGSPDARAVLNEWVSVREAAARAGACPQLIRRWRGQGRVEGQKRAAGWAVRVSSLDAFLAKPRPGGGQRKS